MSLLETLDTDSWSGPFSERIREQATAALEAGKVLFLPRLAFVPTAAEGARMSASVSDGRAKNVSLDPRTGALQGTTAESEERQQLQTMIERFATSATGFVRALLPRYSATLERARTSYRPVEIAGRQYSPRRDDTLLHVDAFPSRPSYGRRILRMFSNIDPAGGARMWTVGEPFADFARKFARKPRPADAVSAWILASLGITKGRRTAYDQLMLDLHDSAKRAASRHEIEARERIAFPPGTSWLCFTDQVLHAAHGGQFALEQTFYTDVAAMRDPELSPLRILERTAGRALV